MTKQWQVTISIVKMGATDAFIFYFGKAWELIDVFAFLTPIQKLF